MITYDVESGDLPIDMNTIDLLARMVSPHCAARRAAWELAARDSIQPWEDPEVTYNIDATDAISELIPEVLR